MEKFNTDNTTYSAQERKALNEAWAKKVDQENLEEFTEEYDREFQWFSDVTAPKILRAML